jgi:hypothetical protein
VIVWFPWAEATSIGVPALVSVASAIFATVEARRARKSEREIERLRLADEQYKYDVYQPMIELFPKLLRGKPPKNMQQVLDDFASWHLIYGSDEAVRAHGHLMQTIYVGAPAQILIRMYAEFFIAARRDLGEQDTALNELAVMEPRIKDLYSDEDFYTAIALRQDQLFALHNWTPPWARAVSGPTGRPSNRGRGAR